MPSPTSPTPTDPDRVFWGEIRRALIIVVRAIERRYGFQAK